MIIDELRAHVRDALASSLNSCDAAVRILARTNSSESEIVLAAAIDFARDLTKQIAELERELDDNEKQRSFLQQDIEALRKGLRKLGAKRGTR